MIGLSVSSARLASLLELGDGGGVVDVQRWVEESCAAQGIPSKVYDPRVHRASPGPICDSINLHHRYAGSSARSGCVEHPRMRLGPQPVFSDS